MISRWLWKVNGRRRRWTQPWPISRYFTGIDLEGLRKIRADIPTICLPSMSGDLLLTGTVQVRSSFLVYRATPKIYLDSLERSDSPTIYKDVRTDVRQLSSWRKEGLSLNTQETTKVYPKVSELDTWSENCKWYSSLPLGSVVSLFCESV
jgi:hypothetical protein